MHISGSAANRGQSSGFCLVRTLFCVIFVPLHFSVETLSDVFSLFESCDSFQVVFIEIYLRFSGLYRPCSGIVFFPAVGFCPEKSGCSFF